MAFSRFQSDDAFRRPIQQDRDAFIFSGKNRRALSARSVSPDAPEDLI